MAALGSEIPNDPNWAIDYTAFSIVVKRWEIIEKERNTIMLEDGQHAIGLIIPQTRMQITNALCGCSLTCISSGLIAFGTAVSGSVPLPTNTSR